MQNKVTASMPVSCCGKCPYFSSVYGLAGGYDFCDTPCSKLGTDKNSRVIYDSSIVQEWCPYKVESK